METTTFYSFSLTRNMTVSEFVASQIDAYGVKAEYFTITFECGHTHTRHTLTESLERMRFDWMGQLHDEEIARFAPELNRQVLALLA